MTPGDFLDALKAFCEDKTKDMLLRCNVKPTSGEKAERPPRVYRMRLPDEKSEVEQIPYVLLQLLKVSDNQKEGMEREGRAIMRIVAATFHPDAEEGGMSLLNLLSRLRFALLESTVIDERYELDLDEADLEFLIYPNSTPPFYLGEMITAWKLPTIERMLEDGSY